jgi:hypothetical protein
VIYIDNMVRDVGIHHIGSLAIVQLVLSGIARLDNGRDKGKGKVTM